MVDYGTALTDDSPGNGAASEEAEHIDKHGTPENDGRGDARTFFVPSESDNSKMLRNGEWVDRWQHLKEYNDGLWESKRREVNNTVDMKRDIDVFCHEINETAAKAGMSKRIDPDEVKSFVTDARKRRERGLCFLPNKPIEATILAAISLLANEQGWFIRHEPRYSDDKSLFTYMITNYTPEDSDVDVGDIRDIRRELKPFMSDN